jgi:hypothetical protein
MRLQIGQVLGHKGHCSGACDDGFNQRSQSFLECVEQSVLHCIGDHVQQIRNALTAHGNAFDIESHSPGNEKKNE